jgi:hypothetical protein
VRLACLGWYGARQNARLQWSCGPRLTRPMREAANKCRCRAGASPRLHHRISVTSKRRWASARRAVRRRITLTLYRILPAPTPGAASGHARAIAAATASAWIAISRSNPVDGCW